MTGARHQSGNAAAGASSAELFEELLDGVANAHTSIVGELHEEIRRLRAQLNCARVLSRGESDEVQHAPSDTGSGKASNKSGDEAAATPIPSGCSSPRQAQEDSDAGSSAVELASGGLVADLPGEVIAGEDTNGEGHALCAIVPDTPAPAPPAGCPPDAALVHSASGHSSFSVSLEKKDKGCLQGRTPKLMSHAYTDQSGGAAVTWSLTPPASRGARRPSLRGDEVGRPFGGRKVLPFGEDSSHEPWPVWYDIGGQMDPATTPMRTGRKSVNHGATKAKSVDFHLLELSDSWSAKLQQAVVAHPNSPIRLCWLCLGVVLIAFDIIAVPLTAFEVPGGVVEQLIPMFSAAYWQIDFFLCFAVGYHAKGNLELRLRMTAWHYASTWMVVDLVLVLIDWACVFLALFSAGVEDSSAGTARVLRSVRTLRYLRTLRLIRVMKIPSLINEVGILKDLVSIGRSEYASLVLGILKHLSGILVINHIIACLWYTIGKDNEGWVSKQDWEDERWTMRYLTSLHWSLTQFTPASMAVQPITLQERAFAVAVLLFALITFSSFVSSITNLMTHLRMLKSEEAKQFAKLERFFRDNGVSFHLNVKVRRYLEHHLMELKRNPQEKDIEMLARLSEPLRMELRYELYSPLLSKHPFFAHFADLNRPAVQRLCHGGIRTIHLSTDDLLFSNGETAKAMHFVVRGILEYVRSAAQSERPVVLKAGDWVGEMVLWTPWEYQGDMTATTESALMALEVSTFHEVVLGSKAGQAEASAYAVQAVERLNSAKNKTDVDDPRYEFLALACRVFTGRVPESALSKTSKKQWLRGMTASLMRVGTMKVSDDPGARDSKISQVSDSVTSSSS